jgi:hypothetical protein
VRGSLVVVTLGMMLACKDAPSSPTAAPPASADRPKAGAPAPAPVDAAAATDDRLESIVKLYDRQEFAAATVGAEAILRDDPDNVRALRIAVSSYCALGDGARARDHWRRLPPRDQQDMTRRCDRLGVTLR